MVTLAGLGGGAAGSLTLQALQAVEEADILIGAPRLLAEFPECTAEKIAEYRPEKIVSVIREKTRARTGKTDDTSICVVYSGDTGFYSGAAKLALLLKKDNIPHRILPGISSVQLFAARLGIPWQDWHLVSAHGTRPDPVREVLKGQNTFFLTGGENTPASLCLELTEAGLGNLKACVGENLSCGQEQIRYGTAEEFSCQRFASLSVLLVYANFQDTAISGREEPDKRMRKKTRLMISAMNSGAGKTILTCGLLRAMTGRGIACEAFKCGPDYIDPMFHSRVLGVPSRNLDIFLQGREGVSRSLACQRQPVALVEGAMGFYDGVAGTTEASAWDVALTQQIPVILAVRPSGSSVTLAAQIRGLTAFRSPSLIAGLILTACRPALYERLRPVLEKETGLPVLGFLPPMEEAMLENRHLGLLTAGEIADFQSRFSAVAAQAEQTIDLEKVLALAAEAPVWPADHSVSADHSCNLASSCVIAVARDEAFCFYYQDSLEALEKAGARLIFFSPLDDPALPDCDGLYLGGGYPELYAAKLAENHPMLESISRAVRSGMPTVAECGGFLYLQNSLEDADGIKHKAAGVLPGEGFKTDRLQRFGYAWLKPETDSLLFRREETVPVHEFHYWDCTENGRDLILEKPDGRKSRCGFVSPTMYAAFPHLHLGGVLPLAERFVEAAKKEKGS